MPLNLPLLCVSLCLSLCVLCDLILVFNTKDTKGRHKVRKANSKHAAKIRWVFYQNFNFDNIAR